MGCRGESDVAMSELELFPDCPIRRDVCYKFGARSPSALLGCVHWRQADSIEVHFRGHKGDQNMKGNVRVRTRDETSGPRAGYRAGGGAVDLMLELLSCHATLPADEPLSSYRSGSEVMVVTYSQALNAFRELVAFAGRNPMDFGSHSLRIGGASTLAVGGDISERVFQNEGRWTSDSYKTYTCNNKEDSRNVSRKLADEEKGVKRQPGEDTVWGGSKRRKRPL